MATQSDWPTKTQLENAKVRQTLAGVEDAVVCINPPFGKVYVKELTKEQILLLADEWGAIPINATPFHYSKGNFDRLMSLVYEDGLLEKRPCAFPFFEHPRVTKEA